MKTTTERNKTGKAGWKLLAAGLALAALSGTAAARDNVSFSISIGVPVPVHAPAPAYIYERPVFYSAPPVVYAPAPRVVYYPAPSYYGPRHPGYGPGPHKHWHKRHGRR